ncbi:methyltransferase [Hoyosella rhizosphaerae]|uniref:Methyltransferase n=1 Tax=Hoyosella rhizosphaerae TaxID=1755582 RepID=A0A916TZ12_9ACTN|nr:methyltransferase [Hoyosella rhizosphaerae]
MPPTGTRPTSDRVREALFSALQARLDFADIRVLDLFAGSGALAIESLSRGAAHATFVENSGRAVSVIKTNLHLTRLTDRAVVTKEDVLHFVQKPAQHGFDLVFADPPYAVDDDTIEALLVGLGSNGWLSPEAFVVVERSARSSSPNWPTGFDDVLDRTYGETRISIGEFATPTDLLPSAS